MDLSDIRIKIDGVDDRLKVLFEERMALAAQVAEIKKGTNAPILNSAREREIITRMTENQPDLIADYTKVLYTTLFDLSRSYQNTLMNPVSPLAKKIETALETTPKLFPSGSFVACQGIEGANSQLACDRLFPRAGIVYFNNFEGVFGAVEQGLCKYGILPIENSIHGSVIGVYDLMQKYNFHIARSVRMKIDHTLLAHPGVKIDNIREIFSHEQALGQCSEFLKGLKNVKVTPCENTAMAAKLVSTSERDDIAAISDKGCAQLYGLSILNENIQDNDNNYTRFICISKELEIYPGANKISLCFTIPHRPGSLYSLISMFSALGINITKLESRPIPGKDFEFMFYFDADASVYSRETVNLLCRLASSPEHFAFLGSYSEV